VALAHERMVLRRYRTDLYVYSSTGNPMTGIWIGESGYFERAGADQIEWRCTMWRSSIFRWIGYDSYGIEVLGDSDNLWLANLLADSQVPNAATTIGFFVHPSVTVGDIHLYNTDSHRNYKGIPIYWYGVGD